MCGWCRYEERIKYTKAELQLWRKEVETDYDCQQIAASLQQLLPRHLSAAPLPDAIRGTVGSPS